MLSPEQNDLLTLVEGDAPMGQMMRRNYWIPCLRAGLLEAGGDPIRVRLFGENFVAFREAKGAVGFLDEHCPHRRASLTLARNEGDGLRCIFHGWKMTAEGKVVEMPNEHKEPEKLCARVPVRHFPVCEAGGMLWVWLGAGEAPKFPDLPYMQVPASHCFVASTKIPVNFVQGLEATLDSSHIGFLHRDWFGELGDAYKGASENLAPRFEFQPTKYGYRGAALRPLADGATLVRLNEFVMPFHASMPTGQPNKAAYQILVPIDNETTWWVFVGWSYDEPYDGENSILAKPGSDIDNWAPPLGNAENRWGQDRQAMRDGRSYAGFKGQGGLFTEDTAIEMSMGPRTDRSKEFLCSGDMAIVRMRWTLLQAVEDFMAGKPPLGTDPSIAYSSLYAVSEVIPSQTSWKERFAAA